jgi:hypothetical protein
MNRRRSRKAIAILISIGLLVMPAIAYAQEGPSRDAGAGLVLAILALVLIIIAVVAIIGAVGLGVIGIGYGISQGDDE